MVQPNWNPSTPDRRGIEARDVGYGHSVVDAAADVAELQWEAINTGDLDTIELFAGQGAQAGLLDSKYNSLRRPVLLDLVEQGDEAWGALDFQDFVVTGVTGTAGMFNENLTLPITVSRLNTFNDGLFIASSTVNSYLEAQFGTGAFGLDRHVLAVEVSFRGNITLGVRRIDPTGSPWTRDFPFWSSGFVSGNCRFGEAIVDGNASTWSHWTPQMIRDYALGGTRKIRITCRAGAGAWRLDRLYLRVFSIPERRRGVGIGHPATSLTWVGFAMQTPNATGAPAVVAGDDLTAMARRITDYSVDAVANAVMPWRYMRGRSLDGDWRQHSQAFTPNVTSASDGLSLMPAAGPQVDGLLSARMLDGATVIADSMPYSLSRGALVYDTTVASQTLTASAGATVYGQAFVVAGWRPQDGRPIAPLRAELYEVPGGSRVLDAVEVSAADVDRLPVSAPVNNVDDQGMVYKTVQFRFPNSETLGAIQYELRLSSPGSTLGRPWRVAALIGEVHTNDQTFGTGVDVAEGVFLSGNSPTQLQLTDATRSSDLLAGIAAVPAAVEDVATSTGSLTAHHAEVCGGNDCDGCADDTMPFVQLTWAAAPSGSPDVAGYQVDRMDDLSPDWERVATVVGRTVTTWQDHEARIGVTSSYRVRVLRTDAVTGDWSDSASVNIPTGQIALAFSSNAGVGLGCVYPEVWDREVVRAWSFLEAGDVVYRKFYGRDRQIAFRPAERRGDSFTRTLLLDAMCSVALPTMAIFQPLRDLAWSPVPYVCVRDGEGNRWFASIEVPEGSNRRADASGTELWLTEIGITEVADRPTVHDTSVAQVTGPVPV